MTEVVDVEDIGAVINCHREPGAKISPPPASPYSGQALQVVLGRQLRWTRLKRGLTLKAVASSLGWSVKRISQHEHGTNRIHPDELITYALLYRVRISSFFRSDCRPRVTAHVGRDEPVAGQARAAGGRDRDRWRRRVLADRRSRGLIQFLVLVTIYPVHRRDGDGRGSSSRDNELRSVRLVAGVFAPGHFAGMVIEVGP
jgi:transcriptional regulator with XRE-family HTH domain